MKAKTENHCITKFITYKSLSKLSGLSIVNNQTIKLKQGVTLTGRNSTGPPRSVTNDDRRRRHQTPESITRRASNKNVSNWIWK